MNDELHGAFVYLYSTKFGRDYFEWQLRDHVFTFYITNNDAPLLAEAGLTMHLELITVFRGDKGAQMFTEWEEAPTAALNSWNYFDTCLKLSGGLSELWVELQEVKNLVNSRVPPDA